MNTTDVKNLFRTPAGTVENLPEVPQESSPKIRSPRPEQAPPPKVEDKDSLELNFAHHAAREKSVEEKAVEKLAEKLPEPEKVNASDILKIVNENAPKVLKSLRAIIANRTGMEKDVNKGINLEQLASTLKAAENAPDPGKRVTDVMSGIGLVPEEQKEQFLKAAEAMLGLESKAAKMPPPVGLLADPAIDVNPTTGNYQPSEVGFHAEVNFDLFFSVSARSSVKSGSDGSGSFYEASQEVAASFEAGFSMKIAGRFLSLSDMAEKIDPKVLDAFSTAVQGLAGLDEDALNRFYDATEQLFGEVEETLGLRVGELGGLAEEVKATAESFFHAVDGAMNEVFPGVSADQIFELPAELDANGSTDLLTLLNSLAEKRDPAKDADALLSSLIAAENARSLGNKEDDLDKASDLLKTLQGATAS